ncbi:MAG: hypothetical protein IJG53_03790 [Eggerthellaceae bacterium]|nr:hypothetical protein [Eggerthellaceae bacterium]
MREERLAKVFDAAEPDEATLDRMWAVIDTAYDAEAAAPDAAPEVEVQAPKPRVRRGGRRWIPAVAAVLVVAVGIGVVLGSGGLGRSEKAFSPDAAQPVATEASGTAPEKSQEYDAYELSNMPQAPAAEPDSADTGMVTGADGRRYSARTLICTVADGVTRVDMDALCAKYGLSIKYDWSDTSMFVVELDHDATVEELAQLYGALEAEESILAVEYDFETYAL